MILSNESSVSLDNIAVRALAHILYHLIVIVIVRVSCALHLRAGSILKPPLHVELPIIPIVLVVS